MKAANVKPFHSFRIVSFIFMLLSLAMQFLKAKRSHFEVILFKSRKVLCCSITWIHPGISKCHQRTENIQLLRSSLNYILISHTNNCKLSSCFMFNLHFIWDVGC